MWFCSTACILIAFYVNFPYSFCFPHMNFWFSIESPWVLFNFVALLSEYCTYQAQTRIQEEGIGLAVLSTLTFLLSLVPVNIMNISSFPSLLADGAPTTLVSLIGHKQYRRCARDLYYFLQVYFSLSNMLHVYQEVPEAGDFGTKYVVFSCKCAHLVQFRPGRLYTCTCLFVCVCARACALLFFFSFFFSL